MSGETIDIPVVIGGQEFRTGRTIDVVSPHEHGRVLAKAHLADPKLDRRGHRCRHRRPACVGRDAVQRPGGRVPQGGRPARRHRGASASTPPRCWARARRPHQAEIDSACELIDFLRFNVHFAERIYAEQPISSPGVWNRMDYRPLEGFVYAITPFNFTAIGGNLPTAPAHDGQRGASGSRRPRRALSNWHFYAAAARRRGCRPGVINFLPGDSVGGQRRAAGRPAPRRHPLHRIDRRVPAAVADAWRSNWRRYRSYPRIVGETGGKDFILAHPSADVDALAVAMVRGAFEYQGQKCSAASPGLRPATRSGRPCASGWSAMIARDPDGRRRRLPQLHGRGDRPEGVRPRSAATSTGAKARRA